jgi:hypothetical protein
MAITIFRNQDGNCITFRGSTNPVYFNACLSGEVSGTGVLSTYVNVRNDIASAGGNDVYEFFQIDYTEFRRADGSPFSSAQETANYITAEGNVLEVAGANYLGTWNANTNTPSIVTGIHGGTIGDFYFVSVDGSTDIEGITTWKQGERIIWNGTIWQQLKTSSLIEGKTISTLHDTQTQIFADGESGTRDPNLNPGWYYTNTENNKINWYFYGDTPIVDNTLGSLSGAYAVIDFRNATSQPFFGIYTTPQGDGQDQTWFRSRINYSDTVAISQALDPAQDGTNLGLGKYLVHTGNLDVGVLATIEPILPRISLSIDSSTTLGLQGTDEEIYLLSLSTSPNRAAGSEEFVVEKFGYIIGAHQSEYLLTALPTSGGSIYDETPENIDFRREATGQTILGNDGQQWGVNSIHAADNGDGTIDILAIPGDQVIYDNLLSGSVTIEDSSPGATIGGVVNALNALFANLPLGGGGDYIPVYPVLPSVDIVGYNVAEGIVPNTNRPVAPTSDGGLHLYARDTDTTGHGARLWSDQSISQPGEYFLVRVTGDGRFLVGLADGTTDTSNSGTADDLEELANDTGAAASGLFWSQAIYDYGSYTAPWTYYGSSTTSRMLEGWSGSSDTMMRYNSTVQGQLGSADGKMGVLMKIGFDSSGLITCWYFDEGRSDTFIPTAQRSLVTPNREYHLVVKLWDGTTTLVEIPEVVLVDENPTTSLIGAEGVSLFGDATGDLDSGVFVTNSDNLDNDGFISSNTIDSAGQYFEFTWTGDDATVGLFYDSDFAYQDILDLELAGTQFSDEEFSFYGTEIKTDGSMEGVKKTATGNTIGSTTINTPVPAGQYYGRVGFDNDGRAFVAYSSDGIAWTTFHRHDSAAPNGTYRFYMQSEATGGNINTLSVGQLSAGVVLNYRYIESPDGSFYYPLFSTEEEANYVDIQNGGTGTSHSHVFIDEPTGSTWYMPDNGGTHAGPSAPVDTAEIIWTSIPTLADDQYAPSNLTLSDYTFAENESVNIQVLPQDVIATVSNLPVGLSYSLGYITGTTRYVASETDYSVTVERSNSYGTTTQSFTITIQDNASLGNLTGWTEQRTDSIQVQPDQVLHYSPEAVYDYELAFREGDEISWTQTNLDNGTGFGGPGQYLQMGIVSDGVDKTTATLGNNISNWDLKTTIWTGTLNHQWATGWVSNALVNTGDNDSIEWKLSYEIDSGSDRHIVLYRNGVEVARSANYYSGDQTLTVAIPTQYNITTRLPGLTRSVIGAGSTTPPSGFVDPVLSGEMSSVARFGPTEGFVQLTETLKVNHRYIVPRTWIESNVLPTITGASAGNGGEKFFFGVPKDAATYNNVDLTQDFHAVFRLEGGTNEHFSRIYTIGISGSQDNTVQVNSTTNAFYDYAIEWDGIDLHVIACNIGDINTQPGINSGGAFSRVATLSNFGADHGKTNQELILVIAVKDDGVVNLTTSGLQQIRLPWTTNTIMVGESSAGNGQFGQVQSTQYDLGGPHAPGTVGYNHPNINAGYTYTYIYHPSMEAGDYFEFRLASDSTTVYTTGVTTFDYTTTGDPSYSGLDGYKGITFVVPSDVPPLRAYNYNQYQSGSFDSGRDVPISGSTYTVDITGISLEGPIGNQTGSNLFDDQDHGWLTINENLGSGERLVFDGPFLADLFTSMPEGTRIAIGLKDAGWVNTQSDYVSSPRNLIGGNWLSARKEVGTGNIIFSSFLNGNSVAFLYASPSSFSTYGGAFIEITNSGNNIRSGISYTDDAATVPYSDWGTSYKTQTGDIGLGLTSAEVVILGSSNYGGASSGGLDASDVDWTALSEVSVPAPATTMLTPWTKAVDFSGASEHAAQVGSGNPARPIAMGYLSTPVAIPTTSGYTSNDNSARPWATCIVFKVDGNNSNQHIWNYGEGASSGDDNIFVRLSASTNLYLGWGREGLGYNECQITSGGTLATNQWYGLYIAHNGARFNASNATPANLADSFDIRLMSSSDGFSSLGSDLSTSSTWLNTGDRMDRSITGDFTIGGRGSNRNFHGKVASMVITTLKLDVPMPTDAEIKLMITDPKKWEDDYRDGQLIRRSIDSTLRTYTPDNLYGGYGMTQIWLMGDGIIDSYANGIRNDVYFLDQNYTKLQLNSMVSNDIETVTIPGLS